MPLVRVHGPDQLDELRHVLHRHAGHRLVEQEDALVGGEEHRELELALVSVRQHPGGPRFAVGEADPPDRPGRSLDRAPYRGRAPPDPHRPALAASADSRTFSCTDRSGKTFETWNVRPIPAFARR